MRVPPSIFSSRKIPKSGRSRMLEQKHGWSCLLATHMWEELSFLFNWRIDESQYHVNFMYTAQGFNYIYIVCVCNKHIDIFSFWFFSLIGYYKLLSIIPCAIQVFVGYLLYIRVYMLSRSAMSHSLQSQGLKPTRLFCPWDFPSNNTGVGFHFLLQGIFPIQGSNPCLLHWQADSLPLCHLGRCQGWNGGWETSLTLPDPLWVMV